MAIRVDVDAQYNVVVELRSLCMKLLADAVAMGGGFVKTVQIAVADIILIFDLIGEPHRKIVIVVIAQGDIAVGEMVEPIVGGNGAKKSAFPFFSGDDIDNAANTFFFGLNVGVGDNVDACYIVGGDERKSVGSGSRVKGNAIQQYQ